MNMTTAWISARVGLVVLAIVMTACSQSPSAPSLSSTGIQHFGAAASGQSIAVLSYESEAGEPIGAARTKTLRLTASQFQVTVDPSQAELHFSIPSNGVGSEYWNLYFEAPSGVLAPGLYNHATRWPFQSIGVPGLSFTGNGRACNQITGRFLIAIAEFAGTQIQRFQARFEQHCNGISTPLRGTIWIDAAGGEPPALAHFPPPPDGLTTFLSYESGVGDYIGKGRSETLTVSSMNWTVRKSPNRPGINVDLQSRTSPPFVFWSADFAAASGTLLQPGSYTGATRYATSSGVPGLAVGGNGSGCGTVRGSFIVHEVQYGPSGEVLRFHATFEQHCDGATAALIGEVRIVADPWR